MKYVVTSREMKAIDDETVNKMKIPAFVLMERAAFEIVTFMKSHIEYTDRILVLCGPGNNGGDGIAAGRILGLQGYQVAILFIGNNEKLTEQTKLQLEIYKNLGLPIENNNKLTEYNIIIDSLFGVGLTRSITGEQEEIINLVNQGKHMVFSVDLPSGISADTGRIMNVAIKANYTITFGLLKLGLLLYPGSEYAGEVVIADIGFPERVIENVKPNAFYFCKEDLRLLPERKRYSNKGTYGKVLVIAGSKGMSGAAYLSAKAAYKSGCGLVKVLTSHENRMILQTSLPEALFSSYDCENQENQLKVDEIKKAIQWASAIVVGPGLGKSDQTLEILSLIMKYADVPVVVDADCLNVIAEELDQQSGNFLERMDLLGHFFPTNTVLTPHLMEFSRLSGLSLSKITDNIIDTAIQSSYNSKLIYAIKDARTIVTDITATYINQSGNHGMATAGSGDVLTGIIAAFLALGISPYIGTCLAVYIHGLAGDYAAKKVGKYSLMASDIIEAIENILMERETLHAF